MPEKPAAPHTSGPPQAAHTAVDDATQVFVDHRELLFSVAYSMLGSVADTEDVLQETWLAWVPRFREPDAAPIEHPRAYLVRIAVNQALARRAAVNRRRESYIGQCLPEPIATPPTDPRDSGDAADAVVRTEAFSMALLVVLETLSPLERAVFVLHEVFGYPHTAIAGMLDRSPSAVRQHAHRAREHVHARRPRYRAAPRLRQQVTERFLAAALGGDIKELLRILAPEVTLRTDGGGKGPASSPRPVHGREKVARLFVAVAAHAPEGLDIRYQWVNGDPAALLFADGSLFAVFLLDLTADSDQVIGIYSITNPDKLARLG